MKTKTPMKLKSILDAGDLRGKYVIVRASLNMPLEDGVVRDDFRLMRALPTLRFLCEQGARTVLIAHIGREPEETLKPVFDELEKYLPAHWGGVITEKEFSERHSLMAEGDILMAENLRQDPREVANDSEFAHFIMNLGEVYVNDAFAVSHREQASVYALALQMPSYAGLNIRQEIKELETALHPEHPALFMLGGAKFDTKMPLVEKFLELYDNVFIGGALANDILKARGFPVGKSLVSDMSLEGSPIVNHPKLLAPLDVIVDGPNGVRTIHPKDVEADETILDCGPLTTDMLLTYIEKAKMTLWNGPFGLFEKGFTESTEKIAKHLAHSDSYSVLGGGDTVAAIKQLGVNDQFDFVSTGGGAMLTFLEKGTTSTIDLLKE